MSRISDEETTRSVLHQNDRRVVEGRPREVVDHFGVAVQDSSTSSPPTPAALNRVNLVNKMLRATCMQISLEFVAPFMISEMAVAVDAQIQRTGRQSRTYLTIYVPIPLTHSIHTLHRTCERVHDIVDLVLYEARDFMGRLVQSASTA